MRRTGEVDDSNIRIGFHHPYRVGQIIRWPVADPVVLDHQHILAAAQTQSGIVVGAESPVFGRECIMVCTQPANFLLDFRSTPVIGNHDFDVGITRVPAE